MKSSSVQAITHISLCTAIMAVLSQIAIPIGAVPVTIQALAVSFIGYFLGLKKGIICIALYICLGAVGAPVFAFFQGGFHMLIGYTGGFIFGFIPLVALCGAFKTRTLKITFGICGVLVCHIMGTLQYMLISGLELLVSFLTASLPFILKDILLVIASYFISEAVNKRLKARLN